MKILVAIPTLARADLLLRNKSFLESIAKPNAAIVLDNGQQQVDIDVQITRPPDNLGITGSWNHFLKVAFVLGTFDVLVILQDDIVWSSTQLEAAQRLVDTHPDVDLLLSDLEFSVQVHRRSNIDTIGYYDERFHPAWCEDDDYALTMTTRGRIYQRFSELDPLPGSIIRGTHKPIDWQASHTKLIDKWNRDFGVNDRQAAYYQTNRALVHPPPRRT